MTSIKNDLSDDKTRAIIHCDLLSISWQNFKNSEEKLVSILNSMNSKSLKTALQTFLKDFNDCNLIQVGTTSILREMDRDLQQINDILLNHNAPLDIINSEVIKSKFDFMMRLFQTNIEKQKQMNGDLEDRLTSLQNENHRIHAEFKEYMDRQQSKRSSDMSVDEEFLCMKEKIEMLEQRFADSENENLFLRCTIEELNQQISQLNSGKDGKGQNLQVEELNQRISVLNIKFEAKNQQLQILQEMLDRKEKEFQSKIIDRDLEISDKIVEIKMLQNTIDDISFKNDEIQYEFEIEKEKNSKAFHEIESLKEKERQCDKYGTLKGSQNGFDESNCKHRSQIKKLTHDLAKLSDRYSEKRERHRHKLLDARSSYRDKIQNLTDNENEIRCAFSDISEKLRITELNLKTVTNEKVTLITKNIKLENEITHHKNETTLFQEKISQLEKQINWMKSELLSINEDTNN